MFPCQVSPYVRPPTLSGMPALTSSGCEHSVKLYRGDATYPLHHRGKNEDNKKIWRFNIILAFIFAFHNFLYFVHCFARILAGIPFITSFTLFFLLWISGLPILVAREMPKGLIRVSEIWSVFAGIQLVLVGFGFSFYIIYLLFKSS